MYIRTYIEAMLLEYKPLDHGFHSIEIKHTFGDALVVQSIASANTAPGLKYTHSFDILTHNS